ncbi:condensation domain-containing protein [Amycolatopsis sp. NPDC051045]|uniref:condensation domain-containing protein n=1 Tax=Amycolatopsis sp. NPDC051045 TaxID=3156922 RepID=UPI0034254F41
MDRTEAETVLTRIWERVLQVEKVGPDDDFFSLGGDSLLALKVIGEAEPAGLSLSLIDLFRNPTPRGACSALGTGAPAPGSGPDLLSALDRARVPDGAEDVYPAARLQLGLIFEGLVSEGTAYLDVVARTVTRPLDREVLAAALARLSARHPVLRTRFDLTTFSEPMQVVEAEAPIPLAVSDRSGLDEAERAVAHEAVMADLAAPFDVESAPLVRVHAAAVDGESFVLAYAFHHAILDGWSEAVFFNELVRTYAGLTAGAPPELPAPVPYREFVRLEREAAADPEAVRFAERLRDTLPPGAAPGGDRPVHRKVSATIPRPDSDRLAELSARWGLPLKSLLLAANCAAVGAVRKTDDPVVGLLLNGRPEQAGADVTLGLFLNQLPVRPGVPDGDWRAAARNCLAAENELLAFRRFPYSAVRRLLGADPFEVMFNYVHFHPRDELLTAGLITPVEDMRDHTSLPIRVEALNDAAGDGLSVHVTADTARYGDAFPDHLLAEMVRAVAELAANAG